MINRKFLFANLSMAFMAFSSSVYAGNICDTGVVNVIKGISGTELGDDRGIGGTGYGEDRGIGGTGLSEDRGIGGTGNIKTKGIGGTGKTVDLGNGASGWRLINPNGESIVIGVVTGFASICVNGVEVHYDQATKIETDGSLVSTDQLNIGQLVSVNAIGRGQEVRAQKISIMHELSGPVSKVDQTAKLVHVMGVPVDISSAANNAAKFSVGDHMLVSGFAKPNSQIQATRIDKVSSNSQSFVKGDLKNGQIAGLSIKTDIAAQQQNVKASGVWNGKVLIPNDIQTLKNQPVLKPNTAFHLQGIASKLSQKELSINGIKLDISDKQFDDKKLNSDNYVVVHGYVDDKGKLRIESLEYSETNRLLERGGKKYKDETDKKASKNQDDSEAETEAKKLETKAEKEAEKTAEKLAEAVAESQEEMLEIAADLAKEAEKVSSDATKELLKAEQRAGELDVEKLDTVVKSDKNESSKLDKSIKIENNIKIDKIEKVGKQDAVERPEKVEKTDRVEKVERPEKIERPEKVERPEKLERPEKVDRIGKD